MHGGMKIYRGPAAAARHYVEADQPRVDDYYLHEGSGIAMRLVATPDGIEQRADMDGDAYESWVGGYDLETGLAKGRLRTDDKAVRFVEVTVNGPKTWSLAAALDPEIGAAYDAAQMAAAEEITGWLAEHATTRVGPRGRQVQVPVEQIEAAVVRHFTSRAGDPHRHLHLQINARVFAAGTWRGLHTVGVRDSLEAINGIGHAAVATNPEFRAVLARHGFTLDPETSEIVELAPFAGKFSARARQIETNIDTYEAEWRAEHPGEEPGPKLRQAWDRRAWADARPDKVVPKSGEELRQRWVEELQELGFVPAGPATPPLDLKAGQINRPVAVDLALTRLGAQRSAWNAADARGTIEQLIAETGRVIDPAIRRELAEDLADRVVKASTPLLGRSDVPEHVRALTSAHVLDVEHEIVERVAARAQSESLMIIEGAAGAGKTASLAWMRRQCQAVGQRMIVVTPTRKAAQVAAAQVGAGSCSAAWLLHQYGYRWDADGRWTVEPSIPAPAAVLNPGDVLVVDEAGMLDQDTARALLQVADHTDASLILVGDRHQLPAVGRGGVLDLAIRYAPDRVSHLDTVRRFNDPEYATLSLRMRTGDGSGEVFDDLVQRGQIVIHPSEAERQLRLAVKASRGDLVVADTREQVAAINRLVHHLRAELGEVTEDVVTSAGERIGVGDRIATRRNDPTSDVANRETWSVVAADRDTLTIHGEAGRRVLPADYVRRHVELAYATTAYGAQGSTVETSHVLIGDHTGAGSAYVGMTRGREQNVAHLVAETLDDARRQWIDTFGRDRADLGPTHARQLAAEAVEQYGGMNLLRTPARRLVYPAAPRPQTPDYPYRPSPSSRPSGPSIGM